MAAITTTANASAAAKNFDLVGHGARWHSLARAVAKDAVPQTLLLSGPAHVGKWTFALRFAQLLLCPQPVTDVNGLPAPCATCRTCHQVEIEVFPDFRVYRPLVSAAEDERDWVVAPEELESSAIHIAQARKFRNESLYRPTNGKRKVMIMVQAERMNEASQNALLKTFEEPIPGLTILLLAEQPQLLKATILSRCWEMKLTLVSDSTIEEWLARRFAGSTPRERVEAVRVAGGRPGAAWNEMQRFERLKANNEEVVSRYAQTREFVQRIARSQPVGALALTEEALRLAALWGKDDLASAQGENRKAADAKKIERILVRSQIATFLDELSGVYRELWKAAVGQPEQAARLAFGLDQIRKTRHYILRNASTNLALDVLFGSLIAPQSTR
jgi:DNA polymerase-3 subunit delta'